PARTRRRPGRRTAAARRAGAPGQPGHLAALDLPGHGVEVVEGELLPVDIQSAYDGHRDLLKLRGARQRPRTRMLPRSIVTRLSWGGLPGAGSSHPESSAANDLSGADAC